MVDIKTKRLYLRPASIQDVPALHRILSDPSAMTFWSTLPHTDVTQTEAWVTSMIATLPHEGEDFIIEHQGEVIGKAGLYRFPEIGYILHPSAWGKGYAQEALHAVLSRAFSVHCLTTVEADVDPRNAASLRLLARLCFQEVRRASRTWRIGGKWLDSVYLQLDRKSFETELAAPPTE